ncbi:hypothetical protein [Actinacidiphila sp. bgisy160]|uniref:hypothetical protein n=1 Tax=Actinacidiphila sp. bgisy160 TaxID=3413796 RepID=UPI003D7425A7
MTDSTSTSKATKATAAAAASTVAVPAIATGAPTEQIPAVGPALALGEAPTVVTLSHHIRIDGRDFLPGAKAAVSAAYARQLRANGYAART